MNSSEQHTQLEGIAYSDMLPVAWEMLPCLPSEGEQHRLNRANEELLQHLLLLDEPAQETEEEASQQEHLKRLEAKLDLLLHLVTEMLSVNGGLPKPHALRLGTSGLTVSCQSQEMTMLKEGGMVRILLYLDPQFPRALECCGHITSLSEDSFSVIFDAMEDGFQAVLDRYVFRQHRRAIAMARRRESP